MIKKVFYNSSLPRSGSTLIQNILGQNPLIHTTPTSGLYDMLTTCRSIYTNGESFKAQDEKQMEKGFKSLLKSALYSFYEPLTEKPYVIDKCRGWGADYEFINAFDSDPKIIFMVRDIRAIYASLEKKFRGNPLKDNQMVNWGDLTGTTTDKRVNIWSAAPPIGPSMDRLYQVLVQGLHEKILFIKFEELCVDPDTQMKRVYEYLDLPYYQHNFNNIEQITHENDKVYGIFGDHIIRQELKPVKEDFREVLGPNACKLIEDNYMWFFNDLDYKI
jgi:sulfotransferase